MESWPGWRTNRKKPPVLILGERAGVELGLRQLRRSVPLRTTEAGDLMVPTLAEILRVKAFLLGERNGERRATMDYVDVAALARKAGEERALAALAYLNLLYPTIAGQTAVTRLAEACEGKPADFTAVDLQNYKGLIAPFNDWAFVSGFRVEVGRQLLKRELAGRLPEALPNDFE